MPASNTVYVGDMNARLGRLSGGSIPVDIALARRGDGYRGYAVQRVRISQDAGDANPRGVAIDRILDSNGLILLNGRSERDGTGAATYECQGAPRSVLDLALVANTCSADLQVFAPREGSMVHRALFVWLHVGDSGEQPQPVEGAVG